MRSSDWISDWCSSYLNENLRQAAVRETLEETGWEVELIGVVGIYLYTAPSNGVTYQRVCFAARVLQHDPQRQLDEGIVAARWLSRDELEANLNAGAANRTAEQRGGNACVSTCG